MTPQIYTIRIGENQAQLTREGESYTVSWAWMGHRDSIQVHTLREAEMEFRHKADAIFALLGTRWSNNEIHG